jgi:hypothetical protein
MKSIFNKIVARLVVANLLVLPVLILLITLTTSNASAVDVSGSWSSRISGEGYVQTSHILDTNSDVELVMMQNGNSITGTIVTTCSYSYLHPGYQSWGSPAIGSKNSNTVTGTLSGSILTLICYSPATSGTSGGISYTTDASSTTWSLLLNGNRLTGSGTYTAAGIVYGYSFDLVSNGVAAPSQTNTNVILTAPVGLAYTLSKSSVNLNWDNLSSALSFNIYRGDSNNSMRLVGYSASTNYDDTTILAGSTYYYAVSAVNSAGEGQRSEMLKITALTVLKGTIVNANGLPLSGLAVTLENGTTAHTNITGSYEFVVLPGTHELTISGSGIQTMNVPVVAQKQGSIISPITTSADTSTSTFTTTVLVVIAFGVIVIAIVAVAMYARQRRK